MGWKLERKNHLQTFGDILKNDRRKKEHFTVNDPNETVTRAIIDHYDDSFYHFQAFLRCYYVKGDGVQGI
jgi:hypothetical protein